MVTPGRSTLPEGSTSPAVIWRRLMDRRIDDLGFYCLKVSGTTLGGLSMG